MRAISYSRVSTTDQANGLSLESQQRAISQEVARRGWELVEEVTEAKSGKNLRSRPLLKGVLGSLRASEADVLVVARLDRLARSLGDLCVLMATADTEGWTLLCLSPMVDLSDPFGRCMAQVAGAFAELERQLIGQRQRESIAARKEAGTYRHGRPTATDESVARILELRAEGLGLRRICRVLHDEKIKPPAGRDWHPKTVSRILERTMNSIYSQPAAAMDHGEDQPEGTIYVTEAHVAAYVTQHAPDVDPEAVEHFLQNLGWDEEDSVADAIDRAIAEARERNFWEYPGASKAD